MSAVNWQRLGALRTPMLMILALLTLTIGVSVGVFMIYVPAGWMVAGTLGGLGLAFIAYVTDQEDDSGRSRRA